MILSHSCFDQFHKNATIKNNKSQHFKLIANGGLITKLAIHGQQNAHRSNKYSLFLPFSTKNTFKYNYYDTGFVRITSKHMKDEKHTKLQTFVLYSRCLTKHKLNGGQSSILSYFITYSYQQVRCGASDGDFLG